MPSVVNSFYWLTKSTIFLIRGECIADCVFYILEIPGETDRLFRSTLPYLPPNCDWENINEWVVDFGVDADSDSDTNLIYPWLRVSFPTLKVRQTSWPPFTFYTLFMKIAWINSFATSCYSIEAADAILAHSGPVVSPKDCSELLVAFNPFTNSELGMKETNLGLSSLRVNVPKRASVTAFPLLSMM